MANWESIWVAAPQPRGPSHGLLQVEGDEESAKVSQGALQQACFPPLTDRAGSFRAVSLQDPRLRIIPDPAESTAMGVKAGGGRFATCPTKFVIIIICPNQLLGSSLIKSRKNFKVSARTNPKSNTY